VDEAGEVGREIQQPTVVVMRMSIWTIPGSMKSSLVGCKGRKVLVGGSGFNTNTERMVTSEPPGGRGGLRQWICWMKGREDGAASSFNRDERSLLRINSRPLLNLVRRHFGLAG
jgi:hypothetical protein